MGAPVGRTALALAATLLACALPAAVHAAPVDRLEGHLSIGYAQLFITDAPAGNLSLVGGVDYPVIERLRLGIDVGYDLLGSRTAQRGSLSANVNYSALEIVAFAHWTPQHLGPVGRISVGPMLMAAHADLAAPAGGAGFSDLAVEETVGGVAAEVSLLSSRPAPVRLGFQLGARAGFVPEETWTIFSARLSFHY